MASLRALLVGALLPFALLLTACGAPADEAPGAAPSPALWEVEGPEGQAGWLFGTAHALPRGARWRTAAIDGALGQARLLVVEIAELGDAALAARELRARATTPGQPPLSQRVPAKHRADLAALMRRAGLDDGDIGDRESWAAALLLANALRSGDSAAGADIALLQEDLPAVGLESFAEQFDRFDRLPPADQTDLLLVMAEETGEGRDKALIHAWLAGDMAAIERLMDSGLLAVPNLRRALLTDRNLAWEPEIARLIESGRRPFIAVGAAHMVGADSLPALLEARGYTVRRVR